MMFFKLIIIVAIILVISFAFLGINILVRKNGRFPNTHISGNHEMKKRGISCAQHNDIGCNPTDESGCSTCGTRRF